MTRALLLAGLCLGACASAFGSEQKISADQFAPANLSSLQCDYRLELTDARDDAAAGSMGNENMTFADATAVVSQRLAAARWSSEPTAPLASVQIKRLYVNSLWASRGGVAVYRVDLAGRAPFLIRAQPRKTGDSASVENANARMGEALDEANQSLVSFLNQQCRA